MTEEEIILFVYSSEETHVKLALTSLLMDLREKDNNKFQEIVGSMLVWSAEKALIGEDTNNDS